MSEIGYAGRVLRIRIDGDPIAAVRSKSVDFSQSGIDISDEVGDGWRHMLAEPEQTGVQISATGVVTVENYPLLIDAWLADTFIDVDVLNPDGTSVGSDGGYLLSLQYSGESQGYVAFTVVIILSGEIDVGVLTESFVVAVADSTLSANIAYSPDAQAWQFTQPPDSLALRAVDYSLPLGLFVTVADRTLSGGGQIATSPDGAVWTMRDDPQPGLRGWSSVRWLSGFDRFVIGRDVAGGDIGQDTEGNFAVSDDGINWTRVFTTGVDDFVTSHFGYSPETGVLLAAGTGVGGDFNILKSVDGGLSWSGPFAATGGSDGANAIIAHPTLGFVVIGGFGGVFTSDLDDGELWVRIRNDGADLQSMADATYWPDTGLLIAVGPRIASSSDGVNWTVDFTPTGSLFTGVDVAISLGRVFALRNGGATESLYESSNGSDWAPAPGVLNNRSWTALVAAEVPIE